MIKNILYVEKNLFDIRDRQVFLTETKRKDKIIERLERNNKYWVDFQFNFNQKIAHLFAQEQERYSALLTHFPYSFKGNYPSYDDSVSNFLEIRKIAPTLPIVIYTGADPREKSFKLIDPQQIIFKSDSFYEDAEKIFQTIDSLLQEK